MSSGAPDDGARDPTGLSARQSARANPDAIAPHHAAHARRRGAAIELFVLGELMDGPHHGYLLRDILGRMLGPYRQISWAAIYPLIHQLEREALIEPTRHADAHATPASGHPRRVLRITDSGRERFAALLAAREPYTAEFHDLFAIKLLYLRWLTPERQREQLEYGLGYLRGQTTHLRHVFTAQSTTAHLPAAQRAAVTRMIGFRLASVEAEERWIEDTLRQLTGLPAQPA